MQTASTFIRVLETAGSRCAVGNEQSCFCSTSLYMAAISVPVCVPVVLSVFILDEFISIGDELLLWKPLF